MRPVFDGLGDVNWSDLSATHGSAAGVPARLRATMSPDPEVRRRALGSCDGDLVHPGTSNSSAPPAIPYLLEILAGGHPDLRPALLETLLMLARGYDETWRPGGFAPARATPLEVACHKAVERGVPQFAALLQDPDSPVRRYAAALLVRGAAAIAVARSDGAAASPRSRPRDLLDLAGMVDRYDLPIFVGGGR
jgi:hypothetical protein